MFVTEVVQRVKQHQMFVTEWYKGSNNTRGLLPSVAMGQTTSEVGYGVCQSANQHQSLVTECYKGSRASQVCYGVVQMVKENHRFLTEWYQGSNNIRSLLGSGAKVSNNIRCFVTEWYKGSNNTRGLLRNCTKCQRTSEVGYGSGTMGQTTSDIFHGVLQRVKEHHRFVTGWYKWSKKITGFLRNGTKGQNNIRSLLGSGGKGQTTSDVCCGVV